jgi:hypothetical protein
MAPRRKPETAGGPKQAPEQQQSGPLLIPVKEETVPNKPCCAPPDLPFPTPEILKKGSSSAEVRASFGAPTFDIVGSREGHVVEKFYYVNREKSRLTVVNIDNGFLTSAESISSPYFQLPGAQTAILNRK